jgi:DNA polymerase
VTVQPSLAFTDGARPETLAKLELAVQACRRCELWRHATQGVSGQGPSHAPIMLVGEQPGDQEDLDGRPFVGPAGHVLDRALARARIDRASVWVTNAVKHFKHEQRGKRRLHKAPDRGEVTACRWWLESERELVGPRVIVAMGATAALGVLGKSVPIMASRGRPIRLDQGAMAVVTVHPSYLLRIPDAAAKAKAFEDFVSDLGVGRALAA